ncbi:hypothetical protein F9L16_02380 [Agarivorans sp. B2Z047]|uniref:hypothetical protein n=1 Tax=Agarivorans sp. B2Z047 TaxID=2652721 RepID=UPI00128CC486|nr:hypothetical protein [Agarivorans sp. B2Z047]MPW27841.1 hypothetical protein [Agarivorans sp. B2Z047]UQN44323.1 hypothetical protein LQZ07_07580 [Agarivorans sp. B2Z047]
MWIAQLSRLSVILVMVATFGAGIANAAHESRTIIYQIAVEGDVVGVYQRNRIIDNQFPNGLVIEEEVELDFSFLWFKEFYQRSGKVMLDNGALKQFAFKVDENQESYLIFGNDKLEQGIHINALENQASSNSTWTNRLLQLIENEHNSNGMALLLNRFEQAPDAILQRSDFDSDSLSFPDYLMASIDHQNTQVFKVLDLDEFDIIQYQVKYLGEKPLSAANRVYVSHGFALNTEGESSELWLSKDKLGAFIVQQSGVDDGDHYSVNMQQYLF